MQSPKTDAEWDSYFLLRWRILRAPWKRPRGSERDSLEESAFHLAIFDDHRMALACGRLHLNSPSQAQIRYMAVDDSARQQGFGTLILAGLEAEARRLNVKEIVLNSRDTAESFYLRHGFEPLGPAPSLYGAIPHIRMRKVIA